MELRHHPEIKNKKTNKWDRKLMNIHHPKETGGTFLLPTYGEKEKKRSRTRKGNEIKKDSEPITTRLGSVILLHVLFFGFCFFACFSISK
jgi:hypothetical protein